MTDENGNNYIRYYDEEYKFWVNVYGNENSKKDAQYFKDILKESYLRNNRLHNMTTG